ncbi:FAS1 domain-containing protein [Naematelia encephala]|uniref:FAS1 domain-containing protein n=1 Tax=Naematelia encephala TaxID=71784 RepID=A0A1Y2B348_9TREE|nr:FAS1 domain-containing protein [Naematelia encephala]
MRSKSLFAGLVLVVGWSQAQQLPLTDSSHKLEAAHKHSDQFHPNFDRVDETFAETIVSTLSASSQHTILLHLLQRAKCIPLLAHIGNATVFAPTDKAWEDWAERHAPQRQGELYGGWLSSQGIGEWLVDPEIEEEEEMDNQNWALRQHLLYHMLNYTLHPSDLIAKEGRKDIAIETTLLFPLAQQPEIPPIPEPGSPWLPRGGEGMLAGHGQRLRIAKVGTQKGGERGSIGVDSDGQRGAAVWDGAGWNDTPRNLTGMQTEDVVGARWTRNGVVIGIQGVLDMPPSIEHIIRNHPSLTYLSHLLPPSESLPKPLPDSLATSPHLTIFAPSNEAFDSLDQVEKRYLEGGYGLEGVGRVAGGGVVLGVGKHEAVGWSDHWGKKGNEVEAANGDDLLIEVSSNSSLMINGTEASTIDIFASNGVVHIVPTLLVPDNFTLLNSNEKVLLSLNATRFVSLLRSANLSHTYVGERDNDNKEEPWTILAPTDEALDAMDRWGGHGPPLPVWTDEVQERLVEPFKDPSPLAALLQYHILPGRLLPGDVRDGMLLGTELRTAALGGARQRLRVDVSEQFDGTKEDVGIGEIRFDSATVLGKPVKSGKSIIYLMSNLLSPPDDVLQTAVSDLQLSTFIAGVYAAELDKVVKKSPATTYFVPRNRAFAALGLTMKYLLLAEGKDDLRKVVKYHAVNQIVYTPDLESGKEHYTTLEGGEVTLIKTGDMNGTIVLRSPTKWEGHDSGESLPANGEYRPARITHSDSLTETGTIHTIDAVILPADVKINALKLIRGSKQSTMLDLLYRAGLGWIVEGREPDGAELQRVALEGVVQTWDENDDSGEQGDEGSDWDMDSLAMPSYTILCPTDKAFSRLNLTQYLADPEALLNLLKLHIIPSQPRRSTLKAREPSSPPKDGQPLVLEDDLVYGTLLSSSSKYGDVAFRATGDNSFIVGIRNARGRGGQNGGDAARVGLSGRGSVRWKKGVKESLKGKKKGKKDSLKGKKKGKKGGDDDKEVEREDDEIGYQALWKGGMALGGGVVLIDSVLIPYEPSWFSRWGWLVFTLIGIGSALLIAAVGLGWWWMTKRKEGYEPLEGEEEE